MNTMAQDDHNSGIMTGRSEGGPIIGPEPLQDAGEASGESEDAGRTWVVLYHYRDDLEGGVDSLWSSEALANGRIAELEQVAKDDDDEFIYFVVYGHVVDCPEAGARWGGPFARQAQAWRAMRGRH
jgi:hypothetical protein